MVPIDFSGQAIKALNHAAMFAKELCAEIVMLSVVEENTGLSGIIGKVLDMDAATNNILKQQDESVVPCHLWSSDLEEVMYNADVPVFCVAPSPAKYGSGFSNF